MTDLISFKKNLFEVDMDLRREVDEVEAVISQKRQRVWGHLAQNAESDLNTPNVVLFGEGLF